MATPSLLVSRGPTGARSLILPLAALGAWILVSAAHAVDPRKLPPPAAVLQATGELWTQGTLGPALAGSLQRGAVGFAFALALGLPLGILLGRGWLADRMVGPTFNAFRQVAPFAWIPLLGAFFGDGEAPKVAFVAVAALPPIVVNSIEGVRAVTREHVELARVLEIRGIRFVTHVVAPSAAPQILTGISLGLTAGWLAVIGAEFFMSVAPGIGGILTAGRATMRMEVVLVAIALTGGVGLLLNLVVFALERIFLRWRPTAAKH